MSRKKIRMVIVLVALFYVIVTVMALALLEENESVLADTTMAEILFGSGEEQAVSTESSTGNDPGDILERWSSVVSEEITREITEEVTDEVTEEITKEITEEVTEKVTEEVTEEVTEGVTEGVTEELTETETSTEEGSGEHAEEPVKIISQTEGKYYSFVTKSSINLMMREYGDIKARVVGQLKPGQTGVIIEKGEEWSRLFAKGTIGYSITDALNIEEISREEFIERVEASGGQYGGD